MTVQIKLDRGGIREVLNSQGVRSALRKEAEEVSARARSSAPVDSGEYRDSIVVVSATTDRAVERVTATAEHAMLIESRTGNLRRALGG